MTYVPQRFHQLVSTKTVVGNVYSLPSLTKATVFQSDHDGL